MVEEGTGSRPAKLPTHARIPGGVWDKLGNRFEARWTIRSLIDLLEGKADAIQLEPTEEEGFEFYVIGPGLTQYHQVKRQLAGSSDWTISGLEQVLKTFGEKLDSRDAVCVFASMISATELQNLCERALLANSASDFEQRFVAPASWKEPVHRLKALWRQPSSEEFWERLRRIRVHTISEELLIESIRARLAVCLEADHEAASSVLFEFVFSKVGQRVRAEDIWAELQRVRMPRRNWAGRADVLRAVEARGDLYLESLSELAIPGIEIERAESRQILSMLDDGAGSRAILLTGTAGLGKSQVLGQVAKGTRQRGWPWLPVRLDRFQPAQTAAQLGLQMGLPGSPPDVLAAIGGVQRVLLLDQFDSISSASGRQAQLYDAVAECVRQARAHEGLRLVVACRRFDYESDDRLKALLRSVRATSIELSPLSESDVKRVVTDLGVHADRLAERQIRLLSVPFHLSLLARVIDGEQTPNLDFVTANDLLGLYWDRKFRDVHARVGTDPPWTDVIDRLCAEINASRQLAVPRDVLDVHAATAQAMVSEGVLIAEEGKISFFHESFFDYAFARRFAATHQEGLMEFLLTRDQELFRRAQVRSVLLYERDSRQPEYLKDLSLLLGDSRIRFHLKEVVVSLLQHLDDPSPEEWVLLRSTLEEGPAPISNRITNMIRSASNWQEFLHRNGYLAGQMRSAKEESINRALNILSVMQRRHPSLAAELLEPYVDLGEAWRERLRVMVGYGDIDQDRRYFDLVLRLVDNGTLDKGPGGMFILDIWTLGYDLWRTHPDWACELAGRYFRRRIDLEGASGKSDPFSPQQVIPDSQSGPNFLLEAARGAPQVFVHELLGPMLKLMELTALDPEGGLRQDRIWQFRMEGEVFGITASLLRSMEEALKAVPSDEELAKFASRLAATDLETANFLAARAYVALAERHPDDALAFLVANPARLELGYSGARGWVAVDLIRVASRQSAPEILATLERLILDLDDDHRPAAHLQFRLLSAIEPTRLGPDGSTRLADLREHFHTESPVRPLQGLQMGFVGPPVEESKAAQFTDNEWLQAIGEYSGGMSWTPEGEPKGGASELANLFEAQFDGDATRFLQLAVRLPTHANPDYFEAALRGAGKHLDSVDLVSIWRLCQRCHELPGRPTGRWLMRLIEQAARHALPDDVIDMVSWYATQDPDPDQDLWSVSAIAGTPYYGGSILGAGINSTRGAAAEALAGILQYHPDLEQRISDAVTSVVNDKMLSVRACAGQILSVLFTIDSTKAISLFGDLVVVDDRLLGTDYVRRFIQMVSKEHFSEVEASVRRMIRSSVPEVSRAGGQILAIRGLLDGPGSRLHDEVLAGSPSVRQGGAGVYAANVANREYQADCSAALIRLFQDGATEVREAAAFCFAQIPAGLFGALDDLCLAFIRSPAFAAHGYHLLRPASEGAPISLTVILAAAEAFLEAAGLAAGDLRTRAAADAPSVSVLLVRAYSQSPDPVLRNRALNAIDNMLQLGAFGIETTLADFER